MFEFGGEYGFSFGLGRLRDFYFGVFNFAFDERVVCVCVMVFVLNVMFCVIFVLYFFVSFFFYVKCGCNFL